MRGRLTPCGLATFAAIFVCARANAQPTSGDSPPPASSPPPTADQASSDAAPSEQSTLPDGPWVAGGLVHYVEGSSSAFRAETGLSGSRIGTEPFRLAFVLTFDHESSNGFSIWSLAPFATGQYELPFTEGRRGRLSGMAELGVGPAFSFVKVPDRPYHPAHWENDVRPAGRLAAALEYHHPAGWLAALQPLGWFFVWVEDELTSTFELGIRAGYQWL